MRHPLTTLALLVSLCAPLAVHAPLVHAAASPAATSTANGRVIVKFRADGSTVRRQALAARPQAADELHAERASALGGRTGLALASGRGVAERVQVVMAQGLSSAQLAARLAADAEVEYAVPDQRRRAYVAPNDPLYASGPALGASTGGPVVGQWYLRAPDSTVTSSINIEDAWTVSTGSPSIVVAVLDTGLRFDHADLQGGNVLPGYDMINDTFTANDGGGRDADASDPGDWVTSAQVGSNGCTSSDVGGSSWHGTEVVGLIGAATANGTGMASIGRGNVRVMPVRVLGRCGGYDSDIQAGMRWAAGLEVPGTTLNPTPARVLNLSLGGGGACSQAYQDVVSQVTATGAVIVASAGNGVAGTATNPGGGYKVSSPADCPGVIAVAGLRHVGTKVGFSDLGPEIALSAPGGNCINTSAGSPCLYPILSLSNSGTQTAVSNAAGGSTYTDSFKSTVGTSFSAPLVAGTVALMLSANPGLSPADVKRLLQSSARAFPTTGGDNGDGSLVTQCTVPQTDAGGNPIYQLQCYCTTSACGAGMLDAGAAVRAAAAATGTPTPAPTPTPTPAPTTTSGGGGGALGWPWLALLAVAVLAAARSTRRRA